MIEIVLDGILASLLRLILSVLLASRNNSGKEMELIIQYCCIISQTILLRILSSLQIAFCSVVKEMDCMDMNCYDAFHLNSCFISHEAPALATFPSLLLITVFIYLLSVQYPLCSSFSPVNAADRRLLVPFQFPLKPSMPARATAPCALHLK